MVETDEVIPEATAEERVEATSYAAGQAVEKDCGPTMLLEGQATLPGQCSDGLEQQAQAEAKVCMESARHADADPDAFPGSVNRENRTKFISFLVPRSSQTCAKISTSVDQAQPAAVHHLMSAVGGAEVGICEHAFERLDAAVFEENRWQKVHNFLGDVASMPDEELFALLRRGATSFGFWPPEKATLRGLVRQVREQPDVASGPFRAWVDDAHEPREVEREDAAMPLPTRCKTDILVREVKAKKNQAALQEDYLSFGNSYEIGCFKLATGLLVLAISTVYAFRVVLVTYPGVIDVFGWPVFVARLGGMGCAIWTAILYLTMAKTLIKGVLRYFRCCGALSPLLDAHKEMHTFAGKWMLITGIVHTLAHCVGTVPMVVRYSTDETLRKKINDIIGCANKDTTPGYMGVTFLQWPDCPVDKEMNYLDLVFQTTFGLSGLLLLLLGVAVWYTSRRRSKPGRFELFWYLHQFTIFSWPVLLFIHGSNGWLGIGFPLVVFACGLPIVLYSLDRVGRFLRYYLFAGRSVQILDCVIRPGPKGGPDGSLTYLKISKPPFLWNFWSGMYAFICVPEIAPLQWHPFTICSGPGDETVDFLISAVGDWTTALAERCMRARDQGGQLPMIALDGPFAAPMQTALNKRLLVAIGAGTGVTPLLSLLSTIASSLEDNHMKGKLQLQEAHFFWMARSADEFLFGRELITKICTHEGLRNKVFLHLHVTAMGTPGSGASYLFRECIRRQSVVDRRLFQSLFRKGERPKQMQQGAQIPWCWINGSKTDVLWVKKLVITEPQASAVQASTDSSKWVQALAGKGGSKMFADVDDKGGIVRKATTTEQKEKCDARQQGDQENPKLMIPIAFGRPDFDAELSAIGRALPNTDAHVYLCGSDQLVAHLRDVCDCCTHHAAKAGRKQHYKLHYERFG